MAVDNEDIQFDKYYFYIDRNDANANFVVSSPDNTNTSYSIDTKFNTITQQWYCKITENKGTTSVTTEWKRIVNSISLNLEYKNVMDYCIACEGYIPIDPDEEGSFDNKTFCFYLTSWDNLLYL